MKTDNEKKNPSFLPSYLQASANGIVRGLVGLPVEHPLEYVRTRMQASPKNASAIGVAKETYRSSGIGGFYAGIGPNGASVITKVAYRCPLMVYLPDFYKRKVFNNSDEYRILQKCLTGFSIATFETGIIAPLDKFKVWLMTKSDKQRTLKDLLFGSGSSLRASFQTWNVVYPRQVAAWTSFLTADETFKSLARRYHQSEELPYSSLIGIGVAVGTVNVVVLLPFEMAVTLVQKDKPWANQGIVRTMQSMYANFGIRGVYTASHVRMLQAIFAAILNVNLLYLNERNFKRANEDPRSGKKRLTP